MPADRWRGGIPAVADKDEVDERMGSQQPSGRPTRTPPRAGFTLAGPSRAHDPRTVAIRADLADLAVASHHFAPHYAAAMATRVIDRAALHEAPGADAAVMRMLDAGEAFALLDTTAGWSWGYAVRDHLVGYVAESALVPDP